MSKIIVVDTIMGGGKTTWAINNIINKNMDNNIWYVTPYLEQITRIKSASTGRRRIFEPLNHGNGKLDNLVNLLQNQCDIASTHELFRRFDDRCKEILKEHNYTLILDEVLDAIEPYHFNKKDDYRYLVENGDITVNSDGLIEWTGENLDTRYNDVKILARNHCLFRVNDKFFIWHFPHEVFNLFENVIILTFMFEGSLMKSYFDLYNIKYELKGVAETDGNYELVEYHQPDKTQIRARIQIHSGKLNSNITQKENSLSATWCRAEYNQQELKQLKNNIVNYVRHIIDAKAVDVMWTTYKSCKATLSGKGYARGFVACNARASNDYVEKTCLIYAVNWFPKPEIDSFFKSKSITINKDAYALSNMLQWIWRSNIRDGSSNKIVNIYIPSKRMRSLFANWLTT